MPTIWCSRVAQRRGKRVGTMSGQISQNSPAAKIGTKLMLTDLLNTPSEQPEVKVVRKFEEKEGKRRSVADSFHIHCEPVIFQPKFISHSWPGVECKGYHTRTTGK